MGTADSTGEAERLAALLSTLKERSGLSYGALGKRLHLSASTLHRYCNGDAVPADFAPLNRFARLCRATPEELVEVHRRWILADAAREQRGKGAGGTAGGAAPAADPGTPADPPDADDTPKSPETPDTSETEESQDTAETPDSPSAPRPRPRRRLILAATAGVIAVAATAALLVGRLVDDGAGAGAGQAAGAARGPVASPEAAESPSPSPSGSASGKPSASPSPSGTPGASPGSTADGKPAAPAPTGVPFHASVRAHAWENQCSQRYLVDREPDAVRPPPVEQDAPAWVAAMGAVSADEQVVEVTLQGKGSETVVLQALHVRVVRTGEPLPWTDYGTGVGCGGGVALRTFDVDLDQGSPAARAAEGQRPFPYKISESDPEMFRVTAHTGGRDVSWYLEVEWSSGERQGVFRVDDRGRPFRTSASAGRPAYDYPPGASEWSEHQPG
ncbi:helix-turn-helix transcriptional regulator [Streptomyces sp. AJ-1]|uniref:helix-turn-helix domain-containing protein n=1 Tax=Streptomyces sp. AJ-1 TaxID=3044384 RepID=UPI00249A2EDB|nr:helix-turn-helix transcriptional regulator [Streptomyces sp. AJ-1]MDI3343063.1 helix-turn-helix transcriptional regulator [Streptomyces sp. AJ-1]